MAKKKEIEQEKIGNYFIKDKPLEFISSGCAILDCVLGGGYPLGRIVNIVGDKSTGKCGKDMYILNDEGLVHLDSKLSNYPKGTTFLKQNLIVDKDSKVKSTASYKEIIKKTYKITTRHGFELECTPEHPLLMFGKDCKEDMVKSKDLKVGDVAIIAKNTNYFGSNTEIGEDLAFLLGCIVANGVNPKYGKIEISTTKDYLKKKLEQTIVNLGFKPFIKPDKVCLYNKQFSEYIWETFFKEKKDFTARYKFIPNQILESPKHIQTSFLRGLIDCDSYYNNNNYLEYYTASEVLAKQVHLILLNIGIISNKQFVEGTFIDEKFYDHKYWTISFGGKYINIYANMVGSDKYSFRLSSERQTSDFDSIPFLYEKLLFDREDLKKKLGWSKNGIIKDGSKFPRLKLYSWNQATYYLLKVFIDLHQKYSDYFDISFYENILNKDYHYDYIVSIEEIYYENGTEVYDVHVPETHRFWCNGFISHNTLLVIEASANFIRQYPTGKVYYLEAEAAFDVGYAETLGMPIDKIEFIDDVDTIEGLFESLTKVIEEHSKSETPVLFAIDSLDALSDKSEKEREIDKGSYGAEKAKKMSELFRRLVKEIEKTKICLMVINQTRDKIGIMFGDKHGRSGGKALDFYSSQILWLSEIEKIQKTIKGIKRPIGIWVKAKCKKNKIALPFRECDLPLLFAYGIQDTNANIDFLKTVKGALEEIGIEEKDIKEILEKNDKEMRDKIANQVKKIWEETEIEFLPKEKKY